METKDLKAQEVWYLLGELQLQPSQDAFEKTQAILILLAKTYKALDDCVRAAANAKFLQLQQAEESHAAEVIRANP